MEKREVINALVTAGASPVKGLVVRNVSITPKESYTQVALTVDKPVKGFVTKDGVTYEEGETNVIFVSAFSIASILKDMDDAAFAANHIVEHPEALNVLLSRAKIDILQQAIKNGEEYKNPWSNSDSVTVFTHDTIINHLIGIQLSEFSTRKLDKLADGLLGL